MYAIVEIAGQQFKVEKDQQLFVHRLEEKEGSKVDFDNVLLIDDNGKIVVGAPAVSGAMVSAKVLSHDKADKVIVFKKKRRKGYRTRNGHRQYMTKIQIEQIVASGAKKAAPKASTKKVEAEVKESKPKAAATKASTEKTAAKKETKAAPKTAPKATTKTAASKSATAKKPAVKKAAPKAAAKKPAAKKPAAKKTDSKKEDKK